MRCSLRDSGHDCQDRACTCCFGVTRHADHDPLLICRPAGFGLCEVLP